MSELSFHARKINDPVSHKSACAIVPVFGKKHLSAAARALDGEAGGPLAAAIENGDFKGKAGETLLLPGAGKAARVLALGCGAPDKFDRAAARDAVAGLYLGLNKLKAKDATLHAGELLPDVGEAEWFCGHLARELVSRAYRYRSTVAKPKPDLHLNKLTVDVASALPARRAQSALDQGSAVGQGINTAKELANLPGNICTPTYLAQHARKLARGHSKLSAKVLDEKKMRELGMGSLLSVSAGSDEPAKLVILEYKGGPAKQKPYVLVGKGITFDTGGISLKPGAKMDEMKYDMGGAAGVLGTIHALRELELPINVVGIVAAAENMPSGRATKPGDVVKSMSGKTIEILNTDAEGRLVLADALTYAERYKPQAVVDLATLTGACVVALGHHATGLYANNEELAEQLLGAGVETHDRAWRMPLWDDYQKQLDTPFADVSNLGGPAGGSVTAACFLARFTSDYPWAHLDIAGTAWDSAPKGATGRPVSLLTRFLMDRATAAGK